MVQGRYKNTRYLLNPWRVMAFPKISPLGKGIYQLITLSLTLFFSNSILFYCLLSILFLMAVFEFSFFIRFESVLTTVVDPAVLALIHLSQGDLCAFLPWEDLCITVRVFHPLIPMGFSVKDDLAGCSSCLLYRLPRGNSKTIPCKYYHNNQS